MIFRFLKKLILRNIQQLLVKQNEIVKELMVLPKGTFIYQKLNLAYEICNFKIEILFSFI